MKNLLYIAALVAICSSAIGQEAQLQVTAASGQSSSNDHIQIDWTLGESFIAHNQAAGLILSEGFHQTFLLVESLFPKLDEADESIALNLFPNPTSSILNVKLDRKLETTLAIQLTDNNGSLIKKDIIAAGTLNKIIDLSNFPSGSYLIQVMSGKSLVKSARIIKLQ